MWYRGVSLPRRFTAVKYPWLDVHSDSVYCKFCVCHTARGTLRSGSGMFISEPFTWIRPDALAQRAARNGHGANALSSRQSAERLVACKQLDDLVAEVQVVSVDGEAFLDAMRCLYFLLKQEIPHTTNFASLRKLAILLGNKTLPRLCEANIPLGWACKKCAIGESLEENLLQHFRESPFFPIILDEATDISVVKQLGLVVCFMNMTSVLVETRFLKLVDLTSTPHATWLLLH